MYKDNAKLIQPASLNICSTAQKLSYSNAATSGSNNSWRPSRDLSLKLEITTVSLSLVLAGLLDLLGDSSFFMRCGRLLALPSIADRGSKDQQREGISKQ